MEPVFLEPLGPELDVRAELLAENARARRMTVFDNWGRPNAEWDAAHRFLNFLLDLLEE